MGLNLFPAFFIPVTLRFQKQTWFGNAKGGLFVSAYYKFLNELIFLT